MNCSFHFPTGKYLGFMVIAIDKSVSTGGWGLRPHAGVLPPAPHPNTLGFSYSSLEL
jgi:hypothetical protein